MNLSIYVIELHFIGKTYYVKDINFSFQHNIEKYEITNLKSDAAMFFGIKTAQEAMKNVMELKPRLKKYIEYKITKI
jgi:uncharacterized protein YjaG (DUF416 family)